ncbi:DEAD/DEAH box helicase [Sphingomonas sp. 1P06PA]|uniref:DEAD/DEAH box helicase n=1 Tax=Sphingomonas sp. 1P06PA TaxID=554121 RepID=UPI0039A4618F
MTKFTDLHLAEPLIRALAAKGYDTPTPIQAQAIPPLLDGKDLCGIAQTGTGKTAAFALPSIQRLAENPRPRPPGGCRMLVLSPTRELASQIAESFVAYSKFLRLSVLTVFGGVPIGRQMRALGPGVDVLVATPGRLLDLIDQRALSLRNVEIFVLDEADQMLDLGFIHALKRIDQLLPKKRQSLFFSATMPKTIAELGDRFLTDPVKVSVAPQSTTAERVEQFATFVNQSEKSALLIMKLRSEPVERALVFTRTKHGADKVVKHLNAAGIGAEAIHGNKSQPQRERTMAAFRSGSIKILIATDIAARGIDVGGVSHVFNFELPNVAEQYVHRIGRTARAGAAGIAMAFVADDERPFLRQIEKLTRVKLDILPLPENFLEERAKLPKPAPSTRDEGPRRDAGRGGPRGARPAEGGEPKRRFPPRRSGSVGAHKGAVRRTGTR